MSGSTFLTDSRLKQHNELITTDQFPPGSTALDSFVPQNHVHQSHEIRTQETTSIADTVLSSLRVEEMVPSGILDGDSVWEEPQRPSHQYGVSGHHHFMGNSAIQPILGGNSSSRINLSHDLRAPPQPVSDPVSFTPETVYSVSHPTTHAGYSNGHLENGSVEYTQAFAYSQFNDVTQTASGSTQPLAFTSPDAFGPPSYPQSQSEQQQPPMAIMQAWQEPSSVTPVNHTGIEVPMDGTMEGPSGDVWSSPTHPVSLSPEKQVNVASDHVQPVYAAVPIRERPRSNKHSKRSSRHRRRSRTCDHTYGRRHKHHSHSHRSHRSVDATNTAIHPYQNVPSPINSAVPIPLPTPDGHLPRTSRSHSSRHRSHYHHHHHHHHHHHRDYYLRKEALASMMMDMDEKPGRKEWEKERNRNGYRTRRSSTSSRSKLTDEEYLYEGEPMYHYVPNGMPTPDYHHSHRVHNTGRVQSSKPPPSNDFLHKDPAIKSVSFFNPETMPTNGRFPTKTSPLQGTTDAPIITAPVETQLPSQMYSGEDDLSHAPPSPARVRKNHRGHGFESDSRNHALSDLPANQDHTNTNSHPSSSENEDQLETQQEKEPSPIAEPAPVHKETKEHTKEEKSEQQKPTGPTTAQLLREHRAASEFIAGIENDSGEEGAKQNGTEGLDMEDPLYVLARMEPISTKLPTHLQDERARDETIFQDEEFHYYRETNLPLGAPREEEEIRHIRTEEEQQLRAVVSIPFANETTYDPVGDTADADETSSSHLPQRIRTKGRPRMNYFVALRIVSKKIKSQVTKLQRQLIELDETVQRACVDVSTAHITLNTLYLPEDDDFVFNIMEAFDRFGKTILQRLIPTRTAVSLTFSGTSTFKDRVLYASIVRDEACDKLEHVSAALRTMFSRNDVTIQSERFDPHLTIMKMSRISRDKRFSKDLINAANATSMHFGTEYVHSLELCSMTDDRDDDDYYTSVKRISPFKAI